MELKQRPDYKARDMSNPYCIARGKVGAKEIPYPCNVCTVTCITCIACLKYSQTYSLLITVNFSHHFADVSSFNRKSF